MSDPELGAAIRSSAPAWPSSPPLAAGVRQRIEETERVPQLRPRLSLPTRRRTVLIVVAATFLLAAAAAAAALVVRIGAETVRIVPGPPTAVPSTVITPDALGRPASPADAAPQAGFDPLVPAALGPPDGMWLAASRPHAVEATEARVVVAWDPAPGLPAIDELPWGAVLIEFRGRADLAAKTVFEEPAGTITGVDVGGRDGLWVTGEHRIVLAPIGGGEPLELRVTGNVLVWQQGDLTMRLETSLDLPGALEIAQTVG